MYVCLFVRVCLLHLCFWALSHLSRSYVFLITLLYFCTAIIILCQSHASKILLHIATLYLVRQIINLIMLTRSHHSHVHIYMLTKTISYYYCNTCIQNYYLAVISPMQTADQPFQQFEQRQTKLILHNNFINSYIRMYNVLNTWTLYTMIIHLL